MAFHEMGAEFPEVDETPTELVVGPGDAADHQTKRWFGVSAFALLALAVGVFTAQAGLLLASALGMAFSGYGRLTSPPPVHLAIERTISDAAPNPGDEVAVSLTVTNDGDRPLPDLRLVDGVPDRATVTGGSPRLATALRSGESTTIEYTVAATRGVHEFEPLTAIVRDVSGATERIASVEQGDAFACEPDLPSPTLDVPLRPQTSQYTGRTPADAGGDGVEFYATREYRMGDPMSRIDWNQTAKTGDMRTVEHRVERSVTVALLVDARPSADVSPGDGASPGAAAESTLERNLDAAREVAASLLADGHSVGLAAFSEHDCWLAPASSDTHRIELRETLATHPAFSPGDEDADVSVFSVAQRLRQRLPSDAQVILFSPLVDDFVFRTTVRLDAHGHRTTVVSPDPTTADTSGHRLASVERRMRITRLRRRGLPVADWAFDESLAHAMARIRGGRSV